MKLLVDLNEDGFVGDGELVDMTHLGISARMLRHVAKARARGLSTAEIEEDLLRVFDFCDDLTLSEDALVISVIRDQPNRSGRRGDGEIRVNTAGIMERKSVAAR